jgi:hypothetical protein
MDIIIIILIFCCCCLIILGGGGYYYKTSKDVNKQLDNKQDSSSTNKQNSSSINNKQDGLSINNKQNSSSINNKQDGSSTNKQNSSSINNNTSIQPTTTLIPTTSPILYPFTSHTFTNTNAIRQKGPKLSAIKSAYSSPSWTQNNKYLNMINDDSIQLWTIPKKGNYKIKAVGIAGGNQQTYNKGGRGRGRGGGETFIMRDTQTAILVACGVGDLKTNNLNECGYASTESKGNDCCCLTLTAF